MGQLDTYDDIIEPGLTAEEASRRVDDWLARLDALYAAIKAWAAANGWTVVDGAPMPMHQEPMERFGLPPRDQPSLTLRSPDGAEIWVWPKALWVIGANGRVDLFSRRGAFVLIDIADSFQPPRWILHYLGKGEAQPFDPGLLAGLI